jgi:hypothetical protein
MYGAVIIPKQKTRKIDVNAARLFKLALHALLRNNIDSAVSYFEQALLQGHELAVRYCRYLRAMEDKKLARDIILCAERLM